jgi:hypothetical protein
VSGFDPRAEAERLVYAARCAPFIGRVASEDPNRWAVYLQRESPNGGDTVVHTAIEEGPEVGATYRAQCFQRPLVRALTAAHAAGASSRDAEVEALRAALADSEKRCAAYAEGAIRGDIERNALRTTLAQACQILESDGRPAIASSLRALLGSKT